MQLITVKEHFKAGNTECYVTTGLDLNLVDLVCRGLSNGHFLSNEKWRNRLFHKVIAKTATPIDLMKTAYPTAEAAELHLLQSAQTLITNFENKINGYRSLISNRLLQISEGK